MSHKQLPSLGDNSFEGLKQTNAHGAEYWSAHDLQPLLGYRQWLHFEQAIEHAITSCKQSGNNPNYHFAGAGKMIELGKGGSREVKGAVPKLELDERDAGRATAREKTISEYVSMDGSPSMKLGW